MRPVLVRTEKEIQFYQHGWELTQDACLCIKGENRINAEKEARGGGGVVEVWN